MEVYAKYFAPTSTPTNIIDDIAPAMIGAFKLTSPSGELLAGYDAINTLFLPGPIITDSDWEDITAPKAYLNYILFDSDYIPYDMGFDQIGKDALEDGTDVDHDPMFLIIMYRSEGVN